MVRGPGLSYRPDSVGVAGSSCLSLGDGFVLYVALARREVGRSVGARTSLKAVCPSPTAEPVVAPSAAQQVLAPIPRRVSSPF